MKLVVFDEGSLAKVISVLRAEFHAAKYLRVSIARGRDRSLEQNNIFHAWLMQLAAEHGEYTVAEYKTRAKLRFFVPVLRAECEDFCEKWDAVFPIAKRGDPEQYERELAAMDLMRVSSVCTTGQFSKALEQMQKYFSTLKTGPCFLEFQEAASDGN
jgi:hypothetical protein